MVKQVVGEKECTPNDFEIILTYASRDQLEHFTFFIREVAKPNDYYNDKYLLCFLGVTPAEALVLRQVAIVQEYNEGYPYLCKLVGLGLATVKKTIDSLVAKKYLIKMENDSDDLFAKKSNANYTLMVRKEYICEKLLTEFYLSLKEQCSKKYNALKRSSYFSIKTLETNTSLGQLKQRDEISSFINLLHRKEGVYVYPEGACSNVCVVPLISAIPKNPEDELPLDDTNDKTTGE